jgi:two-component system NtrC family sensor kinase
MLLVEKMASLGKLAAVVAHEINNPLAGIGTYAKLLDKRMDSAPSGGLDGDDADPEDTRRILQLIETEAMRCGDIVRNLLLFSRNSSAEFAPHEILPLIQRCTMLVRHQAKLASVELDLRINDDLPPIVCDAAQIQQMILALLMNAIEASESGGTVSIRPSYDPDTDLLNLTITDTGGGISPEHLARIFEPFFTTKQEGAGAGVGLGLGLAVVYGIVHRHRGRCDVDSTPESGTTFAVWLPRQQPSEATEDNP